MGAGDPRLNQPLLGGSSTAPSAPPLYAPASSAYAPAAAPPSVGAYPPVDGSNAYPPAMGTPAYQPQQQQGAYAPPVVVRGPATHAAAMPPPVVHIHEGPLIQRVSLAPVLQVCPACGSTGATRVRRERGCCTWLQSFALCWLFCPLFWLPCCLDCSKDLVHRCNNCNAEVARITPC